MATRAPADQVLAAVHAPVQLVLTARASAPPRAAPGAAEVHHVPPLVAPVGRATMSAAAPDQVHAAPADPHHGAVESAPTASVLVAVGPSGQKGGHRAMNSAANAAALVRVRAAPVDLHPGAAASAATTSVQVAVVRSAPKVGHSAMNSVANVALVAPVHDPRAAAGAIVRSVAKAVRKVRNAPAEVETRVLLAAVANRSAPVPTARAHRATSGARAPAMKAHPRA